MLRYLYKALDMEQDAAVECSVLSDSFFVVKNSFLYAKEFIVLYSREEF